jgi:hypothetical protein
MITDLRTREERQRDIVTVDNAAAFWKHAALLAAAVGLGAGFLSGCLYVIHQIAPFLSQ